MHKKRTYGSGNIETVWKKRVKIDKEQMTNVCNYLTDGKYSENQNSKISKRRTQKKKLSRVEDDPETEFKPAIDLYENTKYSESAHHFASQWVITTDELQMLAEKVEKEHKENKRKNYMMEEKAYHELVKEKERNNITQSIQSSKKTLAALKMLDVFKSAPHQTTSTVSSATKQQESSTTNLAPSTTSSTNTPLTSKPPSSTSAATPNNPPPSSIHSYAQHSIMSQSELLLPSTNSLPPFPSSNSSLLSSTTNHIPSHSSTNLTPNMPPPTDQSTPYFPTPPSVPPSLSPPQHISRQSSYPHHNPPPPRYQPPPPQPMVHPQYMPHPHHYHAYPPPFFLTNTNQNNQQRRKR